MSCFVAASDRGSIADLCREFWPQMLLPRRPSRVSFEDYVDKKEMLRLERYANQLIESQRVVSVAPAPVVRLPVLTSQVSGGRRGLRRSRRIGKRPDRYGY